MTAFLYGSHCCVTACTHFISICLLGGPGICFSGVNPRPAASRRRFVGPPTPPPDELRGTPPESDTRFKQAALLAPVRTSHGPAAPTKYPYIGTRLVV